MLVEFSFSNFKCFKDEAILSFEASAISENKESLIIDKDKKAFLPVISIHGLNGGGKSTVIKALEYLHDFILDPLYITRLINTDSEYNQMFKADCKEKNKIHNRFYPEYEEIPSIFSLMLRTDGFIYKYELVLRQECILSEKLFYKRISHKNSMQLLFERNGQFIIFGKNIELTNAKPISSKMSVLTYLKILYEIPEINRLIQWFESILIFDYNLPYFEKKLLVPQGPADNKKKVFKLLNDMDIPIKDFVFESDPITGRQKAFSVYESAEKSIRIPFEEESSGTKKMLSFVFFLLDALENGRLVLADELDAKVHPALLKYIIQLFTDKKTNPQGAQLILTSQDTTNMLPDVLRRDEIYFASSGLDLCSTLYSLIDFKEENGKTPRKDAVFGKRYLEGFYGAIPCVNHCFSYKESENEEQ